jgi:thiol-disulfide isomerase/thioredoxin
MKIIAAFLVSLFATGVLYAQEATGDTTAPYRKLPFVPSFSILQTDSTWFNREQLPRRRPVLVIYFSPDCGHCQLEAEEINKHFEQLKGFEIVMASYKPVEDIKAFAETYQLLDKKNIHIGRDTKYFFAPFYRLKFTPFTAVYNKQGKLLATYDKGIKWPELLALF